MDQIELFFDGASRGNPGKSGAGCYIKLADGSTKELFKPLGIATNNQAEYEGVILGLEYLLNNDSVLQETKVIKIKGDSQLIIKQLNGLWRVKSSNLRSLFRQATDLISQLQSKGISVSLDYVPRNKNKLADSLANKGTDQN